MKAYQFWALFPFLASVLGSLSGFLIAMTFYFNRMGYEPPQPVPPSAPIKDTVRVEVPVEVLIHEPPTGEPVKVWMEAQTPDGRDTMVLVNYRE